MTGEEERETYTKAESKAKEVKDNVVDWPPRDVKLCLLPVRRTTEAIPRSRVDQHPQASSIRSCDSPAYPISLRLTIQCCISNGIPTSSSASPPAITLSSSLKKLPTKTTSMLVVPCLSNALTPRSSSNTFH